MCFFSFQLLNNILLPKDKIYPKFQGFCTGDQYTWDGSDPWEGQRCLTAENLKCKVRPDALLQMRKIIEQQFVKGKAIN